MKSNRSIEREKDVYNFMGKGLTEVRRNLKDSKFKNNGRKTIF